MQAVTDIFDSLDDGSRDQSDSSVRRRKLTERPLFIVMIIVAFVLAIAVAVAAIGGIFTKQLADTFDSDTKKIAGAFPEEGTRPDSNGSEALNILLMGSDSRGDSTSIDQSGPSNQRTDTMMLVHVSADRQSVSVMSIMRDLWVPIPGHGTHKINAAFAYGGAALTVQTVEQMLGVRIDHVAIMDFEGFGAMTSALGGVDVQNQRAFTIDGEHFDAGSIHLEGARALLFVRARYPFVDGDYQRVRNQQAFMKAIVQRLVTTSTLTSPTRISDFVRTTSSYMSVDESFTSKTILDLGLGLRDVRQDDIRFFTIPTAGTGTSEDGQSIVLVNEQEMPSLREALARDELDTYPPAN